MGPVGFEASVRVSFLLGFMAHYNRRYKIIFAVMQPVVIILVEYVTTFLNVTVNAGGEHKAYVMIIRFELDM